MNIQPKPSAQLQKFKNTSEIVKMLEHFKSKHYEINKTLRDSGGRHRCRNWEEGALTIKMITDYIYEQEGLKL